LHTWEEGPCAFGDLTRGSEGQVLRGEGMGVGGNREFRARNSPGWDFGSRVSGCDMVAGLAGVGVQTLGMVRISPERLTMVSWYACIASGSSSAVERRVEGRAEGQGRRG